MKKISLAALALAASSTFASAGTVQVVYSNGMPGISGTLDVVETISSGSGVYDVSNNVGGRLFGFGVSNNDTLPVLFGDAGGASGFSCSDNDAGTENHCYAGRRLTANNWASETIFDEFSGDDLSFEDVFGSFASVAGVDNTINWFDAVDGDLGDGQSETGFFGFLGLTVASSIVGYAGNANGSAFFTAGSATVPGTPNPSTVPLPAAGWMLIAGLGGLGAMRRRRKAV